MMTQRTGKRISTGNEVQPAGSRHDMKTVNGITRRYFMIGTGSAIACVSLGSLISGCGSDSRATDNSASVLVFSDVHFNPFYDHALFPALLAADTGQWAGIFQSSAVTTPSAWGADTNYPLLALSLANIKQNLGAARLVIYTGDILGHYFPQIFYPLYYASQGISPAPATHSADDIAAMTDFTDRTVAFFMDQVRAALGDIPVLFAVGNGDSYTGYGPDSTFLANTASLFYTKFLNGITDQQGFLTTFTSGGYYSVEPAGTDLMVISLNTIIFSPLVTGDNDSAVSTQLDWLDSRLAWAEVHGKKVWLLMHAPPGADLATTAASSNVSGTGQITAATIMWKSAYQTRFLQIIANYPGVVRMTLAGHTHMDEYRTLPSSDVLQITPAISPVFGNNPAFKVLTYSPDTFRPGDYNSINYDLATLPARFSGYYRFSTAYATQGPLSASLVKLMPLLVTDVAQQALYRGYYYSGHNTATSVTDTHFNIITDLNWPIFWCGIGNMDQTAFTTAVNTYPPA